MIDAYKRVELLNPYGAPVQSVTWAEIVVWCVRHIASVKRPNWIERARRAFHRGDGEKLGQMILGS